MDLLAPAQYQRLKASGQLPSPQGVAFAIIKLLQRDDYRIDDLIQLVQSDPAIAGRLLKFANAAAFGHGRPIVSLGKAVLSLGAFRVRDLVLGFSVLHHHRDGSCPGFDYPQFWSRSLATAIAAQTLAPQARVSAEENFTAGLLCDVGELALAALFPQEYGRIQGKYSTVAEQLAAEQAAFDTDHRQLGATMLADWGLPDILVESCRHCEQPEEAGFSEGSRAHLITVTLHFSRTLARICVAGEKEQWSMVPGLYALGAQLGIGPDELSRLADQIAARWQEWGKTLDIRTRELPPFAAMLSAIPPADRTGDRTAAAPHPRHLALVIGNPPAPAVLQHGLSGAGYQVRTLASATDGLMVALREMPQLILLHVDCSDMDAAAFCHTLRESPLGREAVLLLLGPESEQDRLLRGIEAGGDDLLLVPITPQILSARLHAVGRMVQLREEIRRQRQGTVDSAQEWAGSRRRLLQAAMTDALTHLANRRHGMDFLAAELIFARSNNLPLSCLMVDIDHFKRVNDELGHEAGDQVLAAVAGLLQGNARSEDMAFRYGGEEFCIVCPGCNRADAWTIAERMRAAVEAEAVAVPQGTRRVTVSIGCAELDPGHLSPDDLIHEADKALYRAKHNGRNRVEG